MKLKSGFIIFYISLSIVEILAEYFALRYLVYFTKPLLVFSLAYYFYSAEISLESSQKKLFLLALLFAMSGDIFLMVPGKNSFIFGLESFLVMQWLYIIVFRKQVTSSLFTARSLLQVVPFLTYSGFLFWIISTNLTNQIMRIAVLVYGISIAIMCWMAFQRRTHVSKTSFVWVFTGAMLFMISDSLIAIGRFLNPMPLQHIWVMGTYAAAQFLIAIGITKNNPDRF